MRAHTLPLLVFATIAVHLPANNAGLQQGPNRAWGKAACGIRVSIASEKARVSKGGPFVISVIVENISGTRIDLKTIPAFKLGNAAKKPPDLPLTFGEYWCPVNLEERAGANKAGVIVASPSHLIMEKGASIVTTVDLARHGWDKITSSWWPVRDLTSVVNSGKYKLRLDIQVNGSAEPQWIRSNEIEVVIESPAA